MSNNRSRTRNAVTNVITSIGTQSFVTILQFVCRTVFITTLGKEYLGINGLFANILSLLSLTELGIDTAINYKLYKPLKENDYQRIRVLMKFYKYAYAVVGFVILVLGLCLIPFLPYLVSDYETFSLLGINPVLIFILYLMQSVTSYLFFASRSAIIKADQKEYITTVVSFGCTVVLNIVQIVTLLLFKDFILYTFLAIICNIVINLINALIAKRKYKEAFTKTKENLSKEEVKSIFADLGALFLFKVDAAILKATDNIVLSSFIGLAMVGMYSNYLLFYSTINTILGKLYNAVKASMGNLYTDSDIKKQYNFFETMNFITFLLYGTAAVGVAVVANEFVGCWVGMDYTISQPFSILMGIEILCLGIKVNLNQVRNVTGAFRQMWYRPLVGIIINIVVSIAGVKLCGIYGVLIGTICANFFANILMDPKIIHRVSLKNYKPVSVYYLRNSIFFILTIIITAVDMFICNHWMTGHGWFSVIVHIIICGLSLPVTFFIIFRNRHECKYIMRMTKQVIKRKI